MKNPTEVSSALLSIGMMIAAGLYYLDKNYDAANFCILVLIAAKLIYFKPTK